MENVKALAVSRRWVSVMAALRERADSLGYSTQLVVLNAAHFEVPQSRERMFLIGRLEGASIQLKAPTRDQPISVRDALKGLPKWGARGNDTLCEAAITPAKKPILRRSPYAGMLFNGSGRPLDLGRPSPTLPASMGGNRTPIVDQRELHGEAPSWVSEYHRHLISGGEPIDKVPEFMRRITVEEAAALQTFPVEMHWAGPISARYRQIGNAVPPLLAMHVALAVREALYLS
jgi:DNA (cytosine-5)-methyltransferase 1